jgi:hypothetical protein
LIRFFLTLGCICGILVIFNILGLQIRRFFSKRKDFDTELEIGPAFIPENVWESKLEIIVSTDAEDLKNKFYEFCKNKDVRPGDSYFKFQYNGNFVAFIQYDILIKNVSRETI